MVLVRNNMRKTEETYVLNGLGNKYNEKTERTYVLNGVGNK